MLVQYPTCLPMDCVLFALVDDLPVERSRGSIHCQTARLIRPDFRSRGGA